MELKENVIEFLSGDKHATLTFSNRTHITKIKKLYQRSPEDFEYSVAIFVVRARPCSTLCSFSTEKRNFGEQ